MKLLTLLFNILISPLFLVAAIYYFYTQDWREAVFMALVLTSVFTLLQLFVKLIKLVFSTLTFNIVGAIKNTAQILMSIAVLALYWLAYYFVWGANFATRLTF